MFFLTAAPAAPLAGAPVTVLACSYVPAPPMLQGDGFPARMQTLTIVFVNDAQRTATHVRFRVRYGAFNQTIDDVGHFAGGVTITHRFVPYGDGERPGPAECRVEAVAFDDGGSWPAS